MSDNKEFDTIVAQLEGLSHLERIVGLVYDLSSPEDAKAAGYTYIGERGSPEDLFFPNVETALASNEDFHIFAANFLEANPHARIFVGIDSSDYQMNRYIFEHFIVGKTRLCADMALPSVDGSITFIDAPLGMEDADHADFEIETESASVWESHGAFIMQNMIIADPDVTPSVLIRMVLEGTTPLLRVLIATHPSAPKGALMGLLEQADPTEEHLLNVIGLNPNSDDDVMTLVAVLRDNE